MALGPVSSGLSGGCRRAGLSRSWATLVAAVRRYGRLGRLGRGCRRRAGCRALAWSSGRRRRPRRVSCSVCRVRLADRPPDSDPGCVEPGRGDQQDLIGAGCQVGVSAGADTAVDVAVAADTGRGPDTGNGTAGGQYVNQRDAAVAGEDDDLAGDCMDRRGPQVYSPGQSAAGSRAAITARRLVSGSVDAASAKAPTRRRRSISSTAPATSAPEQARELGQVELDLDFGGVERRAVRHTIRPAVCRW